MGLLLSLIGAVVSLYFGFLTFCLFCMAVGYLVNVLVVKPCNAVLGVVHSMLTWVTRDANACWYAIRCVGQNVRKRIQRSLP